MPSITFHKYKITADFQKSAVLFGCVLILIVYQANFVRAGGMKCVVALDNAEKWANANMDCAKTNTVDAQKVHTVNYDIKLEEFDFDDNCFIQCVYTKAGIITSDGVMDKKFTAEVFKGNMTAEMLAKSTEIWDKCIDEAGKISKSKSLNPCKTLGLHDFCFNKLGAASGISEMTC